jgi:2-oxoglutarate dehydrogenase E2 component (dihydrolipoamide succinyltransferase)
MPTDVIMPQMGESIVEGTITKWLKKPGESIQRDEPLFEISTDKVDAEIPAPASGVLKEIKFPEGTTVQVNTVVGTIEEAGAAAAAPSSATGREPSPSATATPAAVEADSKPQPQGAATRQANETVLEPPKAAEGEREAGEGERVHSSPLVRKLAREHNVDLHQLSGSGLGGRITKDDILRFIEQHPAGTAAAAPRPAVSVTPQTVAQTALASAPSPATPAAAQSIVAGPVAIPGEIVAMSPMRKKIAERMVESKRTSAHVHSIYEVDMTRIVKLRERVKDDFERRTGSKLTFMPFFCRAAIHAIRKFPILNSSIEGENVHYHRNVNLGIAVALDWGLIVPVVKNAEEKNFLGLQRTITDLAERARIKKLAPDDVAGGTFTITNPGNYGQMFGLPIIMQPQVAILGVGNIKKQPVVITDSTGMDSIAIRSICHISLGYDHRIVDGAIADQFLREVSNYLSNWNEDLG